MNAYFDLLSNPCAPDPSFIIDNVSAPMSYKKSSNSLSKATNNEVSYVNLLEAFSVFFLLCESKTLSLDEKLNILIVLFQFRELPDEAIDIFNPRFVPSQPTTKSIISLIIECSYLGLCKLYQINPISENLIRKHVNNIYPDITKKGQFNNADPWIIVKHNISINDDIINFLSYYIPVMNIHKINERLVSYSRIFIDEVFYDIQSL